MTIKLAGSDIDAIAIVLHLIFIIPKRFHADRLFIVITPHHTDTSLGHCCGLSISIRTGCPMKRHFSANDVVKLDGKQFDYTLKIRARCAG